MSLIASDQFRIVVGLGKSGMSLVRHLARRGLPFAVADTRANPPELATLRRDFPQVEWLDALPATFDGVVFGNEVLDAMPVHLVIKNPQGWQELQVTVSAGRFQYLEAPASAMSHSPDSRLCAATCTATSDVEQAVWMPRLGPLRSSR